MARTMLKRDKKKNITISLVLLFSIIITFIFTNFSYDKNLIAQDVVHGGPIWEEVRVPLSIGLPFVIVCLCWIMIVYSNVYYLNKKNQEFSLLFLSGASSWDIMKYILYQILFIVLLIIPLAYIGGMIGTWVVTRMIYNYLGFYKLSVHIFPLTYLCVIYGIFAIMFCVLLGTTGYLHRHSIEDFIKNNENMNTVKVKKSSVKSIISVIAYMSGLLIMIFQKYYLHGFIFPCLLCVLGLSIFIRNTIPFLISLWKKKRRVKNKYNIIALSNYGVTLQGSVLLITGIMILFVALLPVLVSQEQYTNEYVTGVFCYLVIILLLVICIIFKILMQIQTRKQEFICMNHIGYIKEELIKMIRKEILIFYSTIIILPMPIVITTGCKFIQYEGLSIIHFIILILIYIIPIILSSYITYHEYKKYIDNSLKGEMKYE